LVSVVRREEEEGRGFVLMAFFASRIGRTGGFLLDPGVFLSFEASLVVVPVDGLPR
jgi:hypothetical protein